MYLVSSRPPFPDKMNERETTTLPDESQTRPYQQTILHWLDQSSVSPKMSPGVNSLGAAITTHSGGLVLRRDSLVMVSSIRPSTQSSLLISILSIWSFLLRHSS